MSKRDDFMHKMDEELALWSARFEALKTKAGKDAKAEIATQLEHWHAAMETVAAKVAELKASAGDQWDVVKLEVDKAWHAIQALLNDGVPRSRILSKEEMEGLTLEQQDAILEAMVIAVVADGQVGQDEIARFNDELGKVPWQQPREEVLKKAQAAQARVLALANVAERYAMLNGIAARLPQGPISEKVLGMMALVMASDKALVDVEKQTLAAFARAFGITEERLAVIGDSLRGA